MKNTKSTWDTLSAIDVNDHTEKKGNLTYLSWAWAWGIVKSNYPSATYHIYRNPHTNQQWDYQEGVGYMCSTSVTIEKETLEMWLPVMDFRNKSMVNNATTFDINKTLMRCLTKNLAMFGLGHYIYAGEDLPEESIVSAPPKKEGKVIFGTPKKTEPIRVSAESIKELAKKEIGFPPGSQLPPLVEKDYTIDLGDHDIFEVLKAISIKKKKGESWEKILGDMYKNLGITIKTANEIKKIYNEQNVK
jgi:hypothetical protein|tara:strand:- start:3632 stop:4369 length:738 start_codon:yes stop_codon:yes gene_type:complete